LLNIDAGIELNIELNDGIIFYFQIDSEIDSHTGVSFYFNHYSGSELTVYLCTEINSEANKQLLIGVVIELGLYVSVCNIFLLQLLGSWCKLSRFAQPNYNVPAIPVQIKICPT